MLLQIPWARVEDGQQPDPSGNFALSTFGPPSSLVFVASREKEGPRVADKVGDEDDERSLDGDGGRFELDEGYKGQLGSEDLALMIPAYRVDLAHDGLESRQTGGQKETAKGHGGLAIVSQGQ